MSRRIILIPGPITCLVASLTARSNPRQSSRRSHHLANRTQSSRAVIFGLTLLVMFTGRRRAARLRQRDENIVIILVVLGDPASGIGTFSTPPNPTLPAALSPPI